MVACLRPSYQTLVLLRVVFCCLCFLLCIQTAAEPHRMTATLSSLITLPSYHSFRVPMQTTAVPYLPLFSGTDNSTWPWVTTPQKKTDLACCVPQGSILGPVLFCLYMLTGGNIVKNHNINFQNNADDPQLYISVSSNDYSSINKLTTCISDKSLDD